MDSPSKRTPTNRLTKKQSNAVRVLADPTIRTMGAAAEKAGISRRHLSRLSQNVPFQAAVQSAKDEFIDKLEKKGLGLEEAADLMVEGSRAVTAAQNPDYKTRYVYLEAFLKLTGVLSNGKEQVKTPQVNTYNYKDAKTEDLLKSLDDQLNAIKAEELRNQGSVTKLVGVRRIY